MSATQAAARDDLVFASMIDFTTRNRRETEAETERLRSSQTAAERALEARERSHRSRVKSLEEQVTHPSPRSLSPSTTPASAR